MSYLDNNGVLYLWQKIKTLFATKTELGDKVDKVSGKGLSSEDFTEQEKAKLSTVESNAAPNVIEVVKKNGTALTVSGKAVDITVPTKLSELSNDEGYITTSAVEGMISTAVSGAYKYKGSVATVSALPSSGNTTGDIYNVESSGMNYAWNGNAWDALGETFTITAITNAEIDTIVAS